MNDDEITLIGLKAVELLHYRCNGDLTWLGDELGDLMLYVFLEQILDAPKVFSKFDTPSDELLTTAPAAFIYCRPARKCHLSRWCLQVSHRRRSKDAIDDAFITLEAIKNDTSREIRLVESTAFDKEFAPEVAEQLKNIIIPSKGQTIAHDTAFGVFLGYSLE
jgi:hypothetical protein